MQEKYKRKKAKKYTTHVTCIRPVARSLADFYFNKIPVKTGWLRSDSLAVLLTQANVGAATRMLVVDGTGGLVAGLPSPASPFPAQSLANITRLCLKLGKQEANLQNGVGLDE